MTSASMDPHTMYATSDLFMTFVARMEIYKPTEVAAIKDYLMTQYGKAANDPESRAMEACVGQFLTQLTELVK